MIKRLLSSVALSLAIALPALSQGADPMAPTGSPTTSPRATLISDSLQITGGSTLVAAGHVEAFYNGQRLTASRILYDQASDTLRIEGPITLTQEGGDILVLAEQAELSADLTEGLLTSARVVMNEQLQLAATALHRVGGRYTAMDQVVASSCKICASAPTPLWEIRARRVVHDQEARQIHFDRAQFRVAGVPVFYIPRLRMPAPTLDRLSGFLVPRMRTTSDLGTGLKLPYFITLGDSRDVTLTPYLTTQGAKTLELRYRQAFRTGAIELNGAITHDGLTEENQRGYLFADGAFALPNDFRLTFGLQVSSDNAYLLDYDYSGSDRLDSRIELSRVKRNGFFSARLVSFQSLRDDEDNDTLPSLIADTTFHRRFSLGPLGGEGGLRLQTHNHYRTSNDPEDSDKDDDLIADGRDMSRFSARIDWRKSVVLEPGIEVTALGEAQLDTYRIRQDREFGGDRSRSHTAAGIELRWPWVKATAQGATHVLEPVVQVIWGNRDTKNIPNEDSTLVEFDEGNLFSLDRFPGSDAVEQATRANIGLSWTRYAPTGWSLGITMGRVFRNEDYGNFSPGSGLDGKHSDWLTSATITWQNGLQADGRVVYNDDFDISKAEMRLALAREDLTLATSALWAIADKAENRPDPTREFSFDAAWRVSPAVLAKMKGSYDFEAERGTLGALGLEFRNECALLDLSLSRRFTSSSSVTPTTSFGLSVDLIGFGSGKKAGPSRRCY